MKKILFIVSLLTLFASCSNRTDNKIYDGGQKVKSCREGVYYSLFVRSFADSNGDGIGDFNGIIEKLDYLNDGSNLPVDFNAPQKSSLGITGIWLLPVFKTASYHGYDVVDYYEVNPDYGTMEDFENLVKKCNERGISVILDMPFNHSSDKNKWFIESCDSKSPKHDWYNWYTAKGKNDSVLKAKYWNHPVWNKNPLAFSEEDRNNYYSGLYWSGMPDFNVSNAELRKEFKSILKFWLDKGVSGFRFDAAMHLYNSAKFENPDSNSLEKTVSFWQEMCSFVKSEKPDAMMVGEVWDSNGIRSEYIKAIGSVFHFDMGTKIISIIQNKKSGTNSLASSLISNYEEYKEKNPDYIDCPFLTNHDQNRFALQLKNNPDAIKLAASMYMFSEGIPFIYYGEEIAMNGAKPDEQIRTPFIWSAEKNNKNQTSWITSKYNKNTIPQDEQNKDKNSILNFYKQIISVKKFSPALSHGRMENFETDIKELTSWKMVSTEEECIVIFNPSNKEISFLPDDSSMQNFKFLFGTKKTSASIKKDNSTRNTAVKKIVLPPLSCIVLNKKKL